MGLSKQRKAELWKIAEDAEVVETYQDRPWTTVVLSARVEDDLFTVAGWSKVCWPDTFSSDRGVELAKHDATIRLYNEMKQWYSADTREAEVQHVAIM